MELLVCILIASLLAALLYTALSNVTAESKKTRCTTNQRNLYHAITVYTVENQGKYPLWTSSPVDTGKNWHRTIWRYLSPSGTYGNWGSADSLILYQCPANTNKASTISYAMNENLKDKRILSSKAQTLVLIDQADSHLVTGLKASLEQKVKGWHQNENVMTFVDGHAEILPLSKIPDRTAKADFWGTGTD